MTAVVADTLRRMIISGELAAGDNLPPEPELMERMGVSRPTLREALRVLESESLIRPRPGSRSGAEVCAPSVEVAARYMGFVLQYTGVTLEDLLRARRVVEPPLAGLLTASRSKRKIKRLRDVLAAEEAAMDDPVAFGEASICFHETVAALAGVDTLTLCVRQFNWVLRPLTARAETRGGMSNPRAHRSHVRLVELMETATPEQVQAYWQEHVDVGSQVMLKSVGRATVIDLFRD